MPLTAVFRPVYNGKPLPLLKAYKIFPFVNGVDTLPSNFDRITAYQAFSETPIIMLCLSAALQIMLIFSYLHLIIFQFHSSFATLSINSSFEAEERLLKNMLYPPILTTRSGYFSGLSVASLKRAEESEFT